METQKDFDYVLVGGGLQNGLLALALARSEPRRRIALVESAPRLGGNHTWCWHRTDLDGASSLLVDALIENHWPSYDVVFPGYRRTLEGGYVQTSGSTLERVVRQALEGSTDAALYVNDAALSVQPHQVELRSGRRLRGELVVDARGPTARARSCAYQKFVGVELETTSRLSFDTPRLMDARVEQSEGFRFAYVLPLDDRRLLIEDTYFSESSKLRSALVRARVEDYADSIGIAVRRVLRIERGVLPLPYRAPKIQAEPGLLNAGYRGGWFHPTTGYSLPLCAQLASWLAANDPDVVGKPAFATFAAGLRKDQGFCAWLNRLVFNATVPEARHCVFERFYRLPAETIQRFYAMRLTPWDRARIVCGRPPPGVRLDRAMLQGLPA